MSKLVLKLFYMKNMPFRKSPLKYAKDCKCLVHKLILLLKRI